jgi:hypothetical protein
VLRRLVELSLSVTFTEAIRNGTVLSTLTRTRTRTPWGRGWGRAEMVVPGGQGTIYYLFDLFSRRHVDGRRSRKWPRGTVTTPTTDSVPPTPGRVLPEDDPALVPEVGLVIRQKVGSAMRSSCWMLLTHSHIRRTPSYSLIGASTILTNNHSPRLWWCQRVIGRHVRPRSFPHSVPRPHPHSGVHLGPRLWCGCDPPSQDERGQIISRSLRQGGEGGEGGEARGGVQGGAAARQESMRPMSFAQSQGE